MKKEYIKIKEGEFKIITQRTEENFITMEEVDNNLKHITERLGMIKEEKIRLEEQKTEQQELKRNLNKF